MKSVFRHIDGVGPKFEEKLFGLGFSNWDLVLANPGDLPIKNPQKKQEFLAWVNESFENYSKGNLNYFIQRFPNDQKWKILAENVERASYFDIETTGLSIYRDDITVAGLMKPNEEIQFYIRNENLSDVLDALDGCELLVTYSGVHFDVPHILEKFRIPTFPCPHLDLRWICYHAGFKGGLKKIEKDLGFKRPFEIENMDGQEAIWLWQAYENGSEKALKRLKVYLEYDIISCHFIAEELLKKLG